MSAGGVAVRHRLAALAALAVVAGVVVVGAVAVLALVGDVRRMPVELALLAIAVVGAWFAVTRRGGYRVVAVLVGTAAAVGYLLVSFGPDPSQGFGPVLVRVGLLAAAVTLVAVAAAVDTGYPAVGRHPFKDTHLNIVRVLSTADGATRWCWVSGDRRPGAALG